MRNSFSFKSFFILKFKKPQYIYNVNELNSATVIFPHMLQHILSILHPLPTFSFAKLSKSRLLISWHCTFKYLSMYFLNTGAFSCIILYHYYNWEINNNSILSSHIVSVTQISPITTKISFIVPFSPAQIQSGFKNCI